MDLYLTPWQKMEWLIKLKRLIAPKEVYHEISQTDDELFEWSKGQNRMFIEPTLKQIEITKEILSKYPSLIKLERKFDADPWIIALAIEMNRSEQATLFEVKRIVVTEEKLRGNKIKIPYVCQDFAIEAIGIFDMFRSEGWRF
jgi:hypothetical protein